jgi:hypothetical protein
MRLTQRWTRDKDGNIAQISIQIEVPDDFPAKHHSALVRVANQCTAKKTIENPPEFVVQTVSRELELV